MAGRRARAERRVASLSVSNSPNGGGVYLRDRTARAIYKITNPGRSDQQVFDGLNGLDMTPTASYCILNAAESYSPIDRNAVLDIYRTPCTGVAATVRPRGN